MTADLYRARGVEVDVRAAEPVVLDEVVGMAGPPGPPGVVSVYEQPDDPGQVPVGSLWIDTDEEV